ncbi:MAG: glycosyltransferase family 1 protein [Bacteroidetes bacterium]|nr:glycosyltransferase family 1 protein [Bacteroidota bacterium]MCH8523015.1 glycosyltransferase family 1 protein [Balneolales bacterium]
MNKLRIVLATGSYSHIKDGVSLTLNRLVRYLLDEGHEVLVLAPVTDSPAMQPEGELYPAKSVSLPGREDYRLTIGLDDAAIERLRTFNPHLIHAATPDILGIQIILYALRKKIPLVCSYHTHFLSYLEYYNLQFATSFIWWFLRWFYGQGEHTYVPSESMIQTLRDQGMQDNMKLWARGIELDKFTPNKRSNQWRESIGVHTDQVLVTMVSRLVWEKEMNTLLETYNLLHERHPNVKTLVVGEGPASDEMKKAMPHTIFTGHLDGEALATAYASSDVFVFPSITETFGNVTLEALSSGVPAVVADAQGNNSLVSHNENGFLVTPRDAKGFAEAIEKLIINEKLRHQFGLNAREFAKKFSWPVIFSGLVDNYYEAIAGYQPR